MTLGKREKASITINSNRFMGWRLKPFLLDNIADLFVERKPGS